MAGAYAVMRHQEPATAALLYGVGAVTHRGLRDLYHQGLSVPPQNAGQLRLSLDMLPEGPRAHAEGFPRNLRKCFERRAINAQEKRDSEHAFVADRGHLDRYAVMRRGNH